MQMSTPSGIFTPESEQNKIGATESPTGARNSRAPDEEIDATTSKRLPHAIRSRRDAFAPICAAPRAPVAGLPFLRTRRAVPSCSGVQIGLGRGHTCKSALADSLWARITGSSQSAGWVALFRARNASAPLYTDLMSVSDLKVFSKFSSQIPHTCEFWLHHLSKSRAAGQAVSCFSLLFKDSG